MTSAAPPAMNGEDSLVPPKSSIGDGPPLLKSVQLANRTGSGVQIAQPSWPGATRSGTRPRAVVPSDEIGAALSLAHEVAKLRVPAYPVCACTRKLVTAPAEMTFGSTAGEPTVLNGPASPVEATTVTPAATAASSASATGSRPSVGYALPPNDSLMTSTLSVVTA